MPDGDWRRDQGFVFYESSLGEPLNLEQASFAPASKMHGRDMSLFQADNGQIFGAVTNYNFDKDYEVTIYKGNDVEHLKPNYINLGIQQLSRSMGKNPASVWAPDFFQDSDGTIFLLTAVNDLGSTVDRNQENIPRHSIYISKLDMENLSVDTTREIFLDKNKNYIDPHLFIKDNKYHLLVKNDYTKVIDYYESEDMEHWKLMQEDFLKRVLNEEILDTEGQFILKIKDTYYLFFDKYNSSDNYSKGQYVVTSKDFSNFTTPKLVTDQDKKILRHGSGIIYKDDTFRTLLLLKVLFISILCFFIVNVVKLKKMK